MEKLGIEQEKNGRNPTCYTNDSGSIVLMIFGFGMAGPRLAGNVFLSIAHRIRQVESQIQMRTRFDLPQQLRFRPSTLLNRFDVPELLP